MNSSPLANKIAGLLSRKSSQPGAATRPARLGFAAAIAAALAAAALGASAPADASVFNYGSAGSAHTVNAGILQLDSAKQIVAGQLPNSTSGTNDALPKTSGALYSFYVLDQRADYKPAGWRFANPLAPTTVTSDIQNLFSANYTLGQQVTPNMAAYWMVNLPSVTAGYVPGTTNPLSQFDILVIRVTPNNSQRVIGLSRAEREVLRDYVDQGGTLWIEDAGNASTQIADDDAGTGKDTPAGLFVDVDFHDGGVTGLPYVSDADHRHPTLTEPNFLSYPELDGLSYGYSGNLPYWISSQSGLNDKPDFDFLSIVVGTTGRQLSTTAQPVIAAGDFGSGHVVIDDCNILGGISDAVGGGSSTDTGFAPANLAAAQSSDLQYAYNVISWSGAESTTDGGDVRHTGAQTTADIGSSLLPSWVYPDPNYNGTLPTANQAAVTGLGVAVSGNIAYVTSLDSTGGGTGVPTLHAFDINPAEDLNQDDNPDDGDVIAGVATLPTDPTTNVPYVQDFSAGLNYDELWSAQIGNNVTNISAPTIAAIPADAYASDKINPTGYYGTVIVEDESGNVYLFDATSNPVIATPLPLKRISSGSSGKFPGHSKGIVPSPVYSHGWLIAPQPVSNGESTEMLVYLGGGAANPPRYIEQLANTGATATADATPVISSPTVAMVPSLDTKYGGSDIVAYVATQQAVYPQFLGSRDEEVMSGPYPSTFETKLAAFGGGATGSTTAPIQGVTSLVGAPEDAYQPNGVPYFSYLSADPSWVTGTTGLEHEPNFRASSFGTLTNPSLDLTITQNGSDGSATTAYTDYDVVPGGQIGGTASGPAILSRHQILAAVGGQILTSTTVEGMAVGDDDTLYVTVNEAQGAYIEAVQEQNPMLNSTSSNGTLVKWRYSIGQNSSYAPNGLNSVGIGTNDIPHFVGAPVVDRNHVYALATDSTGDNAYVLCFNHNANFTLVTGTISESSVTLQQTDENGNVYTLDPSQYNITDSQTGTIAITDFSPQPTSDYVIWPNLSVSIPVTTNLGDNNPANTSTSISSDSSGSGLLAWCSVAIPRGKLATNNTRATPGALREFGSYLYFSNGVITVNSNKVSQLSSVASDSGGANPNPNVIDSIELNSGTFLDGSLAASGTSVIGAGTGGIVGMAYTGTVVADSNRLIEYAPDGSPMWSLDSTTQQAPVLDTTNSTPAVATTNVSLSRPSSVTMLASNDILFADTGNNRCVRVDRGGGVLWELNSFNDPTGLLAPGQPLTLNDPTSVVEWRETYTDTNATPQNRVTIEHYLVADAGNYRVLEIDDIYTNGNIYTTDPREYHVLRWVSHTFDKAGRNYRYTYASRYYNGADPTKNPPEILAGVANRQIAPLIKQSASATPYLDSAARDTAGSSIVLLNYALPAVAIGSFTPPVTTGNPNPTPINVYEAPTYSATANIAVTGTFTDPVNGLPSGLFTQIIYEPTAGSSPVTIPIRNLRYVNAYFPTSQVGMKYSPGENIVLCDDDGVFDGIAYGSNLTANYSVVAAVGVNPGTGVLPNTVGFSFTKNDYDGLSSVTSSLAPKDVFTPTSAQRLDSGDYLITNGASTGDATALANSTLAADVTNNLLHFGGDVFEVTSGATKTQVGATFGRQGTSPVQGSGSNASTTSPLSLPAYAVRSQ